MRRFAFVLVTGAALSVGYSPISTAADLPVNAPVYKAPVMDPYNWSGWYAGGNIGYSWGRARVDLNAPGIVPLGWPSAISLKPDGLIGGAQIGYNWQYDIKWVFGLEADFQGSGEKDSAARNPFSFNVNFGQATLTSTFNQTLDAKIKWFGTLRVRGGVLLTPTTLLYATGGLAYGKVSSSVTSTLTQTLTPPGTTVVVSSTIGGSKTKFGWTLGAGAEGAISNSRDWTWKVEYLYIDFGSFSAAGTDPIIGVYSWRTKVTDNILRVGVNYRFH